MKKLVIAGALLAVPASAFAAQSAPATDKGWYMGAAVGQANQKDTFAAATVNADRKDTAWKLYGGYQYNTNLAVELGYVDLGKATGTLGGVAADSSAKAFELVGVGILPLGHSFSAYGKLGLARWDTKMSVGGVGVSDTGVDLTYGVGAKYDVNSNWAVKAEWQRYRTDPTNLRVNVAGKDIDLLSVGVQYKF